MSLGRPHRACSDDIARRIVERVQVAIAPTSVSTSSSVGRWSPSRAVQLRAIRAQVGHRIWSTSVCPVNR